MNVKVKIIRKYNRANTLNSFIFNKLFYPEKHVTITAFAIRLKALFLLDVDVMTSWKYCHGNGKAAESGTFSAFICVLNFTLYDSYPITFLYFIFSRFLCCLLTWFKFKDVRNTTNAYITCLCILFWKIKYATLY